MYDAVIVGAGTTGLVAARFLAESGYKVLVIDLKSEKEIGEKVCGDAISKEYFVKIPLGEPPEEVIEGKIVGAKLYSPDESTVWTVPGEGYMLNRKGFGQWLYHQAKDAGAEFMFETRALGPIVKDGKVVGVSVRKKDGKVETVGARLVIDASGVVYVVRRALPKTWPVSEPLDLKDTAVAYREIREINEPVDDDKYIRIYVSQEKAPGGYWWLFPYAGGKRINLGLGVQGGVGHKDPMWYFHKYLAPRFPGRVIHAGGGIVPTRRPLDTMVADGFATAGDAAYQVNPIHGGGIGSGMLGAYLLAKVASKALEEEPTTEALWKYNVDFMDAYGAKQAALDVFRIFLQSLTDDEINYGMRNKIIKEEDLLKASLEGELKISAADKITRVIKALGKPSLLAKLKVVADYMSEIREMYKNYPQNPQEFEEWRSRVKALFESYKKELSKK